MAKIYGINPKTLHRWVTKGLKKNQGKIIIVNYFLLGGGRKIRDPIMERKLLQWYNEYHNVQGNKITTRLFKQKALEFSNDPTTFRASKGWLQKFRRRYNIKLNK